MAFWVQDEYGFLDLDPVWVPGRLEFLLPNSAYPVYDWFRRLLPECYTQNTCRLVGNRAGVKFEGSIHI